MCIIDDHIFVFRHRVLAIFIVLKYLHTVELGNLVHFSEI